MDNIKVIIIILTLRVSPTVSLALAIPDPCSAVGTQLPILPMTVYINFNPPGDTVTKAGTDVGRSLLDRIGLGVVASDVLVGMGCSPIHALGLGGAQW